MSRLSIPVEEFTTPNPITAPESATVDELTELMRANEIRHVPIVRDSQVVGIVSERDLRVASTLSRFEKTQVLAADLMVPHPVTVSSATPLDEVAAEMVHSKIGSVIVNDEDNQMLGIFTITDALNALFELVRFSFADNEKD